MVDEQKLRKLAEAATPGPWVTGNTDPLLFGSSRNPGTEPVGFVYGPSFAEHSEYGRRALSTSAFIACANPAAILSLLDELQSMRAAVKQARIDALEDAAAICKANASMCSEGVMRLTLEANADAIAELNHAQWLALENVRHLAARNRTEDWAKHMLRFVDQAGTNKAQIMRDQVAQAPNAQQAEAQEPCAPAQLEAGAKKLAEVLDYPWEHMPQQGRQTMRDNVIAVLMAIDSAKNGVNLK